MTDTVDTWMQEFGGIDLFEKAKPSTFAMDLDVAYRVEIRGASIVQSKKGDVQLKLPVVVLRGSDSDAQEVGQHIEYVTLPKQSSDLELGNYELVSKLTQRRTADIVRILSAANRPQFSLYESVRYEKGQPVYYGFDGKPMDKEAFAEREAQIHEHVIAFVDQAHRNVGQALTELDGTRLYLKKVPNKKAPKYPYTNIYATRPRDGAVFGEEDNGGSEAPF